MGRARIQVVHGTGDNLVTIPHAQVLVDALGGVGNGVTKRIFEGSGHYLPIEERVNFNKAIEEFVEKTEAF